MISSNEVRDALYPVILSGGAGTRLWPLSRKLYPKQFLPLHSTQSMVQETALRVSGDGFADPLVICSHDHRFVVAEQLRESNITPHAIMLEPMGRNTAPAVAVAALSILRTGDDAYMLVLPSDHVILNAQAFQSAVATAKQAASAGSLVTFGIKPEYPETGYGYILQGAEIASTPGAFKVRSFVEKPDLDTARAYVASGDYNWNSGMFLFKASRYIEELNRFHPAMVDACDRALSNGKNDLDFFRLDADAFGECAAESIDYAVMEHTDNAVVVPVDMGWSDVGSWSALWDIAAKDDNGNAFKGDVMALDVKGSYIRTDGKLVAAIGLENMAIIVTDDVVLAAPRDRTQDVKAIVDQLEHAKRHEHIRHTRTYRPWGSYRSVDRGEAFEVKRIIVKPGAAISLHVHQHRSEHWIVVAGTAKVTRDDETTTVHANESTFIPPGVKHRLENPGPEDLYLIEVQSGRHLGSDDIVRFDEN